MRPTGGNALIFLTQVATAGKAYDGYYIRYGIYALFALIISFRVENSMTFNLRVDHVCTACLYLAIFQAVYKKMLNNCDSL